MKGGKEGNRGVGIIIGIIFLFFKKGGFFVWNLVGLSLLLTSSKLL
jgi:hypothetical protein